MRKEKIINIKTRFGNFDSVFESNTPEKGYTVTIPRLKGVITFGGNLEEAKKMAKEAIELHCEVLLEDNLAEIKILNKPRVMRLVRA